MPDIHDPDAMPAGLDLRVPAPHHRWWFFPDLTADEALLFKLHDSDHRSPGGRRTPRSTTRAPRARTQGVRGVPHDRVLLLTPWIRGPMTDTQAGPEAPSTFRNSWLQGPFAPVDQEVTAYDLKVTGTIPRELDGRLLRVGPNPIDPENPVTYNWFTGNGMVHGVRIRDGKAEWYRNRFVRDDDVGAHAQGLPTRCPARAARRRRPRTSRTTSSTRTSSPQAGKTWAFAEAGVLPVELSYELECLAKSDFGGTLNGSWTGHPHRDPAPGELHGMSYYHGWDHVSYQVIDTGGQVRRTVDVPVHGRPVVHDCALTERYAVFLDGPVAYSDELLKAGTTSRSCGTSSTRPAGC